MRLLLGYILIFGALFASQLSGLWVPSTGDTLGFNIPALKSLEPFSITSLLADPLSGRGFPWLVTYGTFDPIAHVLRIVFDEFQTLAWLVYVYFVAGAALFAQFLRRQCSSTASFIGGLIYTCAFFWVASGDYPLAFSLPLFAGMLLILSRAQGHVWHSSVLVTCVVAYGWLAGHFNFVPIILVGSGIYALYHWWNGRRDALIALFVGTALGTGIGEVKLLPAYLYGQLSERAGGLDVVEASTGVLHPSTLITALFPYVSLPLVPGEIGGLFYGAMGLALLTIGIVSACRGTKSQRTKLKPALGGLLLSLLIALPHSPLYAIIQQLPVFEYLRSPVRWVFLGDAAVAWIAAMVVDDLLKGEWRRIRVRTGRMLLFLTLLALILSGILLFVDLVFADWLLVRAKEYFDVHVYAQTSSLPLEHYHRAIDAAWNKVMLAFSLLSPRFVLPLLGLALTGAYLYKGKIQARSMIALTIITLVTPLFFYHPIAERADLDRVRDLYASKDLEGYVMPVMPGFADFFVRSSAYGDRLDERFAYQLALLLPNTHALLGVQSIDFYQPLQPKRMAKLLGMIGSDNGAVPHGENLALAKLPLQDRLQVLADRSALFALLNVSTVVSAWELPLPFKKIGELKVVDRLPPILLYAVPQPRPIAYAAQRTEEIAPDEEAAMALLREINDPKLSVIECSTCPAHIIRGGARVEVLRDEPLNMELHVDAWQPSWIVVSRPKLPGWEVYLNGERIQSATANGMFFGIPVDTGEHKITLTVRYKSLLKSSVRMLLAS